MVINRHRRRVIFLKWFFNSIQITGRICSCDSNKNGFFNSMELNGLLWFHGYYDIQNIEKTSVIGSRGFSTIFFSATLK